MAFGYLSDFVKYMFGVSLPLPIPMFGLWVAIAFLVAAWILKLDIQRRINLGELPSDLNAADLASNICLFAGISGIIGARLFHILEYPGEFASDPWGMIFTRGGYSILGGVLFGLIVNGRYVVKKGLSLRKMLDTGCPSIMIGYAIGRIGCQMSGDGDWGIAANMALKPSWLPDFLWAFQYKGNVIGAVIPPPGVYPTPLYESIASFLLFGLLWSARGLRTAPGWLFGLYLFVSGVERFLVEKIRINAKYDLGLFQATQAELISFAMMVGGLILMVMWFKPDPVEEETAARSKRGLSKKKKKRSS